ncbi:MAG TPA: GNAT family N-acetyltransferase [Candidatus Limnocylindrales bacterium]|jgi:CelD/BcsL family acetyltransferase involved in cellulose biosynthesis|nr:GNAT family N-acetyltransferase [Candidatus Limnocylindrales bacterium]
MIVQPVSASEPFCQTGREGAQSCRLSIDLVPGRALSSEEVIAWRQLQGSNPELCSPCFSAEFTQAVASVRDDVEVALIRENDRIVAIFPFQRRTASRAVPVGGLVSDYQGLICQPGFTFDPQKLLKACNLTDWNFDRLLASQCLFVPYHKKCTASARIDLSRGYVTYVRERRAAGTHQIKRCEYMIRRMQREIGPVRFVVHSLDPKLLAQVLGWKSQQYRQSGWNDLFATDWGRRLVDRVHCTQNPNFAGMLSLLFAGQRLVAGHLGMRSRTVWHYWFPAYDRQFAKYSPGLILLLKMAQYAEPLGLQWIDIGTGITLYKKRLMNASVMVAEGKLERPSCRSFLRRACHKLKPLLTFQR